MAPSKSVVRTVIGAPVMVGVLLLALTLINNYNVNPSPTEDLQTRTSNHHARHMKLASTGKDTDSQMDTSAKATHTKESQAMLEAEERVSNMFFRRGTSCFQLLRRSSVTRLIAFCRNTWWHVPKILLEMTLHESFLLKSEQRWARCCSCVLEILLTLT